MALRDILAHFGVTVDQTQLVDAQKNVNKLIGQFNGLARIATFALGAFGVRALTDSADAYLEVANRLRAATDSAEAFAAAEKSVFDIARQTATPVADVTEQFQRYKMATENLGVSQEEVLDFTKRLNQATKLGGATAQETRGALIQLAQGLGTDFKAAGQEIRSIQKSAPLLANIIAKAAGGSASELTALAKAGKLTSKLVFDSVREAGDLIDKEFASRKLRFEDISNLFGIEWMALIKQLEPAFSKLILQLVDLVTWTRNWVEDGSAMNTVVAGTVVVVGLLTAAFGGLAISALLAAAPIIGLFLILEDIVGFFRGDDSVLGTFLESVVGKDSTEKFRAIAQTWGDILTGILTGSIDKAMDHASKRLAKAFGIEPTGPQQLTPEQQMQVAEDNDNRGVMGWIGDNLLGGKKFREDIARARVEAGWTPEQAGLQMTPATGAPPMTLPWDSKRAVPDPQWGPMPARAPEGISQIIGPTNITNNVVVQGNATPEVARDVATQTGRATAAAYGRGRDAIGASLGMQQ